MELAKQWTKSGHVVEKFCLTDAFGSPKDLRGLSWLRVIWFPRRVGRYIRENGHRFDLVDALTGTVPFSKSRLGFHGLMVSRSVGLYRSYEEFTRSSKRRWSDQPRGKFLGQIFYSFISWQLARFSDRCVQCCDLINVPNEEERSSLESNVGTRKPIVVQPYGLNETDRAAFAAAAQSSGARLRNTEVVFIGMWSLRKGSRDWAELIRLIRNVLPNTKFAFLGTMTDDETLFKDLRVSSRENILHVSSYDPAELPRLLASATVGIFPSYIEGFGLAVLEQLAAGIPTVAYDVPGPRQILASHRTEFLVPIGNVTAMADRAVEILRMEDNEHATLAEASRRIADRFRWETIAAETIDEYANALACVNPLNQRQTETVVR